MRVLHLSDCVQHLFYLIGFRLPVLAFLDVDPWVAPPRRFVNVMTCTLLTGRTKEVRADICQLGKTHILWCVFHLLKGLVYLLHSTIIVPLLALKKPFYIINSIVVHPLKVVQKGIDGLLVVAYVYLY